MYTAELQNKSTSLYNLQGKKHQYNCPYESLLWAIKR